MISIGFLLGNKDEAVVWRGPKKNGMIKQFLKDVHWGDELEYLVIDCPPGTTDEHLSVVQYLGASTPGLGFRLEGSGFRVWASSDRASLLTFFFLLTIFLRLCLGIEFRWGNFADYTPGNVPAGCS